MKIVGIVVVLGALLVTTGATAGTASTRKTATAPRTCDLKAYEDGPTGHFGFRDRHKQVVIAPRFTFAFDFQGGDLAAIVDDGGVGYVDCLGRSFHVIPFDNGPDDFQEGLARFKGDDGRLGYLDRRGQTVIPAQFDWAWPFCHRRAKVASDCVMHPEGEHTGISCKSYRWIDHSGHTLGPAGQDEGSSCD